MAGGLQQEQLLEGPVIGASQSGFIADQQGEGLSVVGQPLKDPREVVIVVHPNELLVDGRLAARHFVFQNGGFDGQDAAQAPAGGGHGVDQFRLDAAVGIELMDVGIEEELVVLE